MFSKVELTTTASGWVWSQGTQLVSAPWSVDCWTGENRKSPQMSLSNSWSCPLIIVPFWTNIIHNHNNWSLLTLHHFWTNNPSLGLVASEALDAPLAKETEGPKPWMDIPNRPEWITPATQCRDIWRLLGGLEIPRWYKCTWVYWEIWGSNTRSANR